MKNGLIAHHPIITHQMHIWRSFPKAGLPVSSPSTLNILPRITLIKHFADFQLIILNKGEEKGKHESKFLELHINPIAQVVNYLASRENTTRFMVFGNTEKNTSIRELHGLEGAMDKLRTPSFAEIGLVIPTLAKAGLLIMPKNLTPRQQKANSALLMNYDITRAAKEAGVSRETVDKWKRQQPFQDAINAGVAAALEGLTRSLAVLRNYAARTLACTLVDSQAGPSVKVRAADVILGRLLQLKELVDLENRVEALEQSLKGQ